MSSDDNFTKILYYYSQFKSQMIVDTPFTERDIDWYLDHWSEFQDRLIKIFLDVNWVRIYQSTNSPVALEALQLAQLLTYPSCKTDWEIVPSNNSTNCMILRYDTQQQYPVPLTIVPSVITDNVFRERVL